MHQSANVKFSYGGQVYVEKSRFKTGKRLELTMLKKDLKDPEAPSIEVQ